MIEVFKNFPLNENYQVSNLGRVRSSKTGILKPNSTEKYDRVSIYVGKKQKVFGIHVLVAMTYLNHKPDGQRAVVDHINNNKRDNKLSNLQIINQRDNSLKDIKVGKSGVVGASYNNANKKWQVRPRFNGVKINVGYFDDAKFAGEVYKYVIGHLENIKWSLSVNEIKNEIKLLRDKTNKFTNL